MLLLGYLSNVGQDGYLKYFVYFKMINFQKKKFFLHFLKKVDKNAVFLLNFYIKSRYFASIIFIYLKHGR